MAGLLPLLILPVLMYFLLIRPQQRKMREQQALMSALGDGDEVMTTAGIFGFITAMEGDIVWLEIADGVEIRVTKAAIGRRVTGSDAVVPDVTPAPGLPTEGDAEGDQGTAR